MAAKKRGLGRGLDALLGAGSSHNLEQEDGRQGEQEQEILKQLPVDLIQRGRYQPRTDMQQERLEELAESIRAQGVVQPIIVRPIGGGRYEIIAGERRWRASQIAGLHEIPSVIREVADEAALAMALIENIQREDLNPLEEALAFDRLQKEFALTHQQVADAVGRSRAGVSNLLRLLELNEDVKRLVEHGDLEMGHARALLAVKGNEQSAAARQVVEKGMSVRETEAFIRKLREPEKTPVEKTVDPDVRRLQDDLSEKLGAKVQIRQSGKGKGKLVIDYNNLDELEGILTHIR